jgi:hypothetical protein
MSASKESWNFNEALYQKTRLDLYKKIGRAEESADDFIDSCVKIATFLMKVPACKKHLTRLNSLLFKELFKTKPEKKSLRKILEEELSKVGFYPKFAKAYLVVDASIFKKTLLHGVLLKDTALAITQHGELTHALQWLMIAWEQEETHFLGEQSVVEIFKQLGEEKSFFYDSSTNKEINLWDLIVDTNTETPLLSMAELQFKSPEVLFAFITSPDLFTPGLETLRTELCERFIKKLTQAQQLKPTSGSPSRYQPKTGGLFMPLGFEDSASDQVNETASGSSNMPLSMSTLSR